MAGARGRGRGRGRGRPRKIPIVAFGSSVGARIQGEVTPKSTPMASHVQLAVEIRSIEKGSTSNTEEMPKKLGMTGTMVANTEILTQKSMELRASQSSETVTVVKINKTVNPVQKPADRAE